MSRREGDSGLDLLGRPSAMLLVVGVWLGVGLLSASQYYLAALSAGAQVTWGRQLLRELPGWQAWSLLTPLVFAVAARFPLHKGRLLTNLPVHLVAAVACALAAIAAWVLSARLAVPNLRADYTFLEHFGISFRVRFNVAFLLYWTLVAVHYGLASYRRLRDLEVGAARAEAAVSRAREEASRAREELTSARLQALRSQLQPHFLFNTLHSIASYMETDVITARRLVARLGGLLRSVLSSHNATEVSLAEELAFVDQYLEIERIRYGERLDVRYEVDRDAEDALVPPLVLQPLVENAVRHGISRLEAGGTVMIRAQRRDGWLLLEVRDSGPGVTPGGAGETRNGGREGIGLANTRARLRHLYEDRQSMRIEPGEAGGTVVAITIPYREVDRSPGPDG